MTQIFSTCVCVDHAVRQSFAKQLPQPLAFGTSCFALGSFSFALHQSMQGGWQTTTWKYSRIHQRLRNADVDDALEQYHQLHHQLRRQVRQVLRHAAEDVVILGLLQLHRLLGSNVINRIPRTSRDEQLVANGIGLDETLHCQATRFWWRQAPLYVPKNHE